MMHEFYEIDEAFWKAITPLVGRVAIAVEVNDRRDEIAFTLDDGAVFKLMHCGLCCERVEIEDINGDWNDISGTPILVAEERKGEEFIVEPYEVGRWTFYTFRTIKGSVDVRWYGEHNGYYSSEVDWEYIDATGNKVFCGGGSQ